MVWTERVSGLTAAFVCLGCFYWSEPFFSAPRSPTLSCQHLSVDRIRKRIAFEAPEKKALDKQQYRTAAFGAQQVQVWRTTSYRPFYLTVTTSFGPFGVSPDTYVKGIGNDRGTVL